MAMIDHSSGADVADSCGIWTIGLIVALVIVAGIVCTGVTTTTSEIISGESVNDSARDGVQKSANLFIPLICIGVPLALMILTVSSTIVHR